MCQPRPRPGGGMRNGIVCVKWQNNHMIRATSLKRHQQSRLAALIALRSKPRKKRTKEKCIRMVWVDRQSRYGTPHAPLCPPEHQLHSNHLGHPNPLPHTTLASGTGVSCCPRTKANRRTQTRRLTRTEASCSTKASCSA